MSNLNLIICWCLLGFVVYMALPEKHDIDIAGFPPKPDPIEALIAKYVIGSIFWPFALIAGGKF